MSSSEEGEAEESGEAEALGSGEEESGEAEAVDSGDADEVESDALAKPSSGPQRAGHKASIYLLSCRGAACQERGLKLHPLALFPATLRSLKGATARLSYPSASSIPSAALPSMLSSTWLYVLRV